MIRQQLDVSSLFKSEQVVSKCVQKHLKTPKNLFELDVWITRIFAKLHATH
jgi:hypothetical protein